MIILKFIIEAYLVIKKFKDTNVKKRKMKKDKNRKECNLVFRIPE